MSAFEQDRQILGNGAAIVITVDGTFLIETSPSSAMATMSVKVPPTSNADSHRQYPVVPLI